MFNEFPTEEENHHDDSDHNSDRGRGARHKSP